MNEPSTDPRGRTGRIDDLFRALCDALPLGVVLTDSRGQKVYANAAFEALGCPELMTPRAGRVEQRVVRGGEERILSAVFAPLPAEAGFVGIVEDCTERHRAQDAVKQSESRLRGFFDSAGVGLALASREGKLVRVNRAYARFLRREDEKLEGRDLLEIIHPDFHAHMLKMREELRAGRIQGYEAERRYLRGDGTWVWGLATVTRVEESDDLVGVVQDIETRKRAEDAVRKLSGRFLRLQDEERRRIARSLHESAAQTVAALAMNLQRMERMQLPAHAAEALGDSLALVSQASREIRTLSHLLHPPLLEESGLPSALRWYVEGFGSRSNVKVELELAGDVGRLPTEHEITLFRIVQEALTNVHRHSGSATAAVRLRKEGAGQIVVEVEDHGVGIAPELLSRLRSEGGGVGVGIAGMRERLVQLGGTLEIESGDGWTLVRARIGSEG